VGILGMELVRALAAFGQETEGSLDDVPGSDKLYAHSAAVAALARAIAIAEKQECQVIEECFIGGLLHDLGELVLAWRFPDDYAKARRLASEKRMPMWEAEESVFGATHAEVGGYLMGLWGLSEQVVESTVFHHRPAAAGRSGFRPLVAVHVASALEYARSHVGKGSSAAVDAAFLDQLGLADRLSVWQETFRALCPVSACQDELAA
jgi:HD-like signal output (HDOD) protein